MRSKTLEGTESRITKAKYRISEVEDRMVEINETERKKEKKNEKKWGQHQRPLGSNGKRPSIRIIGVPEEEDKKKDHEKVLEEIIVENFPTMGKEIITQVQEPQRVPNRINPRRNTPRHILIKLTKIKHKEQILKAARGKTTNNTQGNSHKDNSWSFNRNSSGQKGMAAAAAKSLKVVKENNLQPRLLCPARISFKYEGEIKIFTSSKSWENSAPPNQLSNKC